MVTLIEWAAPAHKKNNISADTAGAAAAKNLTPVLFLIFIMILPELLYF